MMFGVLLIVCVALAQDISRAEENPPEQRTELRDYNQDWKAVDYFPTSDTSGWIPQSTETEEQVPKRRRIRKRKRRPLVELSEDQSSEETTPRRRTRPQILDQIREPWEDMSDDMTQRSNSRRRLTPTYDEIEEPKPTYEKIRDPFTALQEAEEKQKKKVEESSTSDIKALLKQSGGLSLSEMLQQKNLSLSELLKGNRQTLSALAKKTEASTEAGKYRRLPPSVGLRKDIDRNFERSDESDERLSSYEVVEAQRKRLALLHHKDGKFSDVTKLDVVTEATTEKRIFVPSTTIDEIDITLASTTTAKSVVRARTKARLPVTSAKLTKKMALKAVAIDINEVSGFSLPDKNATEALDGPFKMTIDLDEVATTEQPRVTTEMSVGEKLKHVTAKEEIMEILKNPSDRERLSRILLTRNMTVEELVEQRERGSSQLHLADIFHNKTREPEPKDEPFIGQINSESFNNFSFFHRKQKSLLLPVIITTPSPEPTTRPPQYTITSFPTYKIEMTKNLKPQPLLPVWKQLYPSLFTDVHENNHLEERTPTTTEKIIYEDLEAVEDVQNALAEATNDKLNNDLRQHVYDDDDEFINLPSGVKSAILASLAIIGLSLLVFLTILVIFKWSQKQKQGLTYTGSFSGSRIKSPILEPDQKRSFRAFMTETLGRKRNYYKTHLQSMSDSIWENEKKSYMI